MDRYDFNTQRLFVEFPLGSDVSIEADRSQSNYLLNVLRMKEGAKVLLFNGTDGEWLGVIQLQGKRKCKLLCLEQVRAQPPASELRYLFAPLKQARLDYLIQKAVEMGAGIIQPVITQHTQVKTPNVRRMTANVIEAAEQCGILSIPRLETPVKLPKLLGQWDTDSRLIFCDETAEDENVANVLRGLKTSNLAVLVGPEGGFSDDERSLLRSCEFVVPISLGPRILRADTAAVAALALVQATIGDW